MSKRWIVSGGLIAVLGSGYTAQATELNEKSVYKAASLIFSTFYNQDGKGVEVRATLANEKDQTIGEVKTTALLPTLLKQQLFSPTTSNPFRAAYAVLYTPTAFKQLQNCPLVGIEFDLDNNRKTQEWYIATSTVGCVKNQLYIDGGTSHNWILQKTEKGQFRVLMESDSTLHVAKLNNKRNLYKPMETLHALMRFNPRSKLECGAVSIDWVYNTAKQQYQLGKTYLQQVNCPNIQGDTNNQRMMARIKGEIDPWINNTLRVFR